MKFRFLFLLTTLLSPFVYSQVNLELKEEQTKNWLTLSWLLSIRTSLGEGYKIYVPEGTITDDFSIDME